MTPIVKWTGKYFGFIQDAYLFDAIGHYLGWVEKGQLWPRNGAYVGDVIDENYLLRATGMALPIPRNPRIPLTAPIPPTPALNRTGRLYRSGWVDARNDFEPNMKQGIEYSP
jgi:hypothetical protein